MAKVQILKESDFGLDGNNHIYPVTVTDAIYDQNNKPLIETIQSFEDNKLEVDRELTLVKNNISDLENNDIELSENQATLEQDYNEFKIIYSNNLDSINQNIETVSSAANFKIVGAVKHGVKSRIEQPQICTNLFTASNKCILGNDVTDYLEENSILILSNPGQYTVGEQIFTVNSVGLIFYKNNIANFIDLEITVLPTPPESGKYLLQSVNGTISWTEANS